MSTTQFVGSAGIAGEFKSGLCKYLRIGLTIGDCLANVCDELRRVHSHRAVGSIARLDGGAAMFDGSLLAHVKVDLHAHNDRSRAAGNCSRSESPLLERLYSFTVQPSGCVK